MKINSLQISNVLSFKHTEDIALAEKISFQEDLNIIIGENGAGKSTALEVINFLFKKVFSKQYALNQELYNRKGEITVDAKRQILLPVDSNSYSGFRLEPNWNTEESSQKIRVIVKLDEIDLHNISQLKNNNKLHKYIYSYSTQTPFESNSNSDIYTLDIILNNNNKNFSIGFENCINDFGYEYLTNYNFYKETIRLYNLENPDDPLEPLFETFTLISSYRNYHAFAKAISLRDQTASQQIQVIRTHDFSKSLNTSDNSEPPIFGLVRLRMAETHFDLVTQNLTSAECEAAANDLPFVIEINKRLKIINLKCEIKLIDLRTWQYGFEFLDLRRNKILSDINSLSAGQKAIVHLVFEAYGRGNIKGGLVIIDEPEIHLHYQFQNEYLQVIKQLNKNQNCQYILVTHSEALITSSTINQVKRFSLSAAGYTQVKAPRLNNQQKMLIKILDNTRSTYAFFAKKVILVEGDTDRYFFKSIIFEKYPQLDQEIAVLYIEGKNNYSEWKKLFTAFGLTVYFITDLDYAFNRFYPNETKVRLDTPSKVNNFKIHHLGYESKILGEYSKKIFILKNGDLENYMKITKKGLDQTIDFCNNGLGTFLEDDNNPESLEIREIMETITN